MSGESSAGLAPTDSRYRVLLDASSATVEQPTVKAVLHSLREVLSRGVSMEPTYIIWTVVEKLCILSSLMSSGRCRHQNWYQELNGLASSLHY
jgi:hypothetical protein